MQYWRQQRTKTDRGIYKQCGVHIPPCARATTERSTPRFTASIFRRVNVNFCASKWPRPPIFDAHIQLYCRLPAQPAWHSSTVASRRRACGARSAAHPDLHACQPASTTLQSNENPYKLHVPSNMSSNFISYFYLSVAPMILLQIFSLQSDFVIMSQKCQC